MGSSSVALFRLPSSASRAWCSDKQKHENNDEKLVWPSPAGPVSSATFVNSRPAVGRGFDHADDRLNRAGATAGVRRRFKFRQFETNEFAHADELAHQRAQRRRV